MAPDTRRPVSLALLLATGIAAGCCEPERSPHSSRTYGAQPAPVEPAPAAPSTPDGAPEVAARFVGSIVGGELPKEPVRAIPVDPDPRFTLQIQVSRYLEGSVPGQDGELLTFLIHSPAIFFRYVLGEPSAEIPAGEFEFTLTVQRFAGVDDVAYDLAGKRSR